MEKRSQESLKEMDKFKSYKGFLTITDDQKVPCYWGIFLHPSLLASETRTSISALEAPLGR